MITTAGKNYLTTLVNTVSGTPFAYLAVGSGTTAPSISDTALVSEITRVLITPEVAGNVITYSATLAAGVGTGTLTEAGLFNASSSGTLFTRVTFAPIAKGAGDTVILTFTETIG